VRHATDRSNVAEQATIRRRDLQDSVNVVKQGDRPSGPPPAITVVQRRSR